MVDNDDEIPSKKPRLQGQQLATTLSEDPYQPILCTDHNDENEDEQLRHFEDLGLLDQDIRSPSNSSCYSGQGLQDEDIDKMLEANLPEDLLRSPTPNPEAYTTRKLYSVQEQALKKKNLSERCETVSGNKVYFNPMSRACTKVRAYFLGAGSSVRNHDGPEVSEPCLSCCKAIEEEENQKRMTEPLAKFMENQKVNVAIPTVLIEEPNEHDSETAAENFDKYSTIDQEIAATQLDPFSNKRAGSSFSATRTDNELKTDRNYGRNYAPPSENPFHIMYPDFKVKKKKQTWNRPLKIPGLKRAAKIASVEDIWSKDLLAPKQRHENRKKLLKDSCSEVKTSSVRARRRSHDEAQNILQRHLFPEGLKVNPFAQENSGDKMASDQMGLGINTHGRSYVSIFHDYVSKSMNASPTYAYQKLAAPFKATVSIGGQQYGKGYGTSKLQAKQEAAKASLKILLPDMEIDKEDED